jgi:predicted ATP-dependent endonuclease of OLD family
MATSIRLKRLRIEQLFGSHDIDIPFRLDERVTVLHGRNGSGKTVTLKLIEAVREGRLDQLMRYPFKRLILELVDGSSLAIVSSTPKKGTRKRRMLTYTVRREDLDEESGNLEALNEVSEERQEGVLLREGFKRYRDGRWKDPQPESLVTLKTIVARYRHILADGDKCWELRQSLPPIKFIGTERLFIRQEVDLGYGQTEPSEMLTVEHLGEVIRGEVREANQQYRQISTELDVTLPKRLFEPLDDTPDLEDLRRESVALRESEARLQTLGLMTDSPEVIDETSLKPEQVGTFYILLQDRKAKLAPFADLSAKAERLLKSLNTKLAPKQVRLNVEDGYQVVTASGLPLPLDRLSSGEQHELVLLHELLFDLAPGTLVLIDEPELSLHVTWQQTLVPELMEIAQLAQLDFVLATHSPFIVGDEHAHLMVRLGEPQP